jgi:midasin
VLAAIINFSPFIHISCRSDGPLLQAMKSGAWILLDELNLAGQSILEGLNALLDHRGEIFVPEINMTISCAPGFRLFGAQNPVQEGGGRKGLPKSFLNRFIRVRMSGFNLEDLVSISGTFRNSTITFSKHKLCIVPMIFFFLPVASAHPSIPNDVIQKMTKCLLECSGKKLFYKQPGLDFNLRDLLRWANLVEERLVSEDFPGINALEWSRFYGNMLLVNRMRSFDDREWVERILDKNLIESSALPAMLFQSDICIDQSDIKIGNVQFSRRLRSQAILNPPSPAKSAEKVLLRSFSRIYQSLLECVKHNWLSILTGSFGSGKTTCISILASLLGHKVIEIQLHQGTDISDLLGGFEQVDIQRDCSLFLETAKQFLRQLAIHTVSNTKALQSIKTLWLNLFESNGNLSEHSSTVAQTVIENEDVFCDLVSCVVDQEEGEQLRIALEKLLHSSKVHLENEKSPMGKFEWMDGTLTKCITDGTWVILRDANLCNPSVLDRLNSLFEPGGNVALNECGSLDHGTRVVSPHKHFRMFITYNSDN